MEYGHNFNRLKLQHSLLFDWPKCEILAADERPHRRQCLAGGTFVQRCLTAMDASDSNSETPVLGFRAQMTYTRAGAENCCIRDVRPVRCVMFPEGSRKVSRSLGFLSVQRCTELTMGAGT